MTPNRPRTPRWLGLAVLTLAAATIPWRPSDAHAQLVTAPAGQVQGHLNDGAREFLGIPYAAPPVGALRWKPPAPAVPWVGVLDAADYPPACAQLPSLTGTASESEDCLYLNVWTPDPAPAPSDPRPVMVWIHGGSNIVGSSGDFVPFPPYTTTRLYDAHQLSASQNVVVVTLNYRVGVFGFFGHAGLASEDPSYPYAGNQGLLDQRAALQWVRDNIAAFGGDPGNVTIFGESAGSWDVCTHVVSPLSNGLFHRAISESGGCSSGIASAADGELHAGDVSTAVGCNGAPDELACLRAASVSDLLDAAGSLDELDSPPTITVDGGFLPAHPRDLFDAGTFADVPYLLGANQDEGTLFFIGADPLTPAEYTEALQDRFGATLAAQIEAVYPVTSFPTPLAALTRVIGDGGLLCATYDVAKRVAAAGRRTYVYEFIRVPPLPVVATLKLGAFHGSEIPYVFGSIPPPTAGDIRLSSRMQQYWTRFADKGRNPRAKGSPAWPRFRTKTYQILQLNGTVVNSRTDVRKIKNFRRTECDFWSTVYEQND
jgi:para-nitrobenzyl esterase